MDRSDWIALSVISLSVVSVLLGTGWLFLVQKNYHFVIEAACDTATQTCFERDCSTEDSECPPNELERYTIYRISAKAFEMCTEESCANECASGKITCEEQVCDELVGDTCTSPVEIE